MSTKITIRIGKGYHIWRDCNDPEFIYIADNDGNELRFSETEAKEIGLI